MKKKFVNGLFFGAIILGFALTANAQTVLGGYKSAATDNERVVAAANFAVDKRVETHTEQEGLTLDSIDKAEMQSVGGINYRVCMTVSIDDESQQVRAVVYQNLKQEYSLTSWEVVESCN
ncbi:hypothetical protein BH10ACI1_BH10ACI1_08400 [soil metagenome]